MYVVHIRETDFAYIATKLIEHNLKNPGICNKAKIALNAAVHSNLYHP